MTKRLVWMMISTLAILLVVNFANQQFTQAATVPEAPVEISLVGADGKTAVTGATAILSRLDFQTATNVDQLASMANNYTNKDVEPNANNKVIDVSSGSGKSVPVPSGKYAVSITKNNVTLTTIVAHKVGKNNTAKPLKLTFLEGDTNATSNRIGAIAGKLSDTTWLDDNTVTQGTVIVQSKTMIWTVKTDAQGFFRHYVTPGSYKVTAVAGVNLLDPTVKRSHFPNVTVVKSMNTTPIMGVKPTVAASPTLGFQLDDATVTNVSSTYQGKAYNGAKVTIYALADTNKYTLLGEGLVKDSKTEETGTFKIKIPQAQPGAKIVFVVEDKAGRIHISNNTSLGPIDLEVVADTSKNELGQPIDLTYKDLSKIYGKTAKLEMRFVPNTGTATNFVTLKEYDKTTKTGDYKVASNKITISEETFTKEPFFYQTAGKYEIKITQDGFQPKTVDQRITDALTVAKATSVKATPGSSPGSMKLEVSKPRANSKVYYEIAKTALTKETLPKVYKDVTADVTATTLKLYPAEGIKEGIDPVTNKFVRVYEILSYTEGGATKHRVVGFKEIPVTEKTMNAKPLSLSASAFTIVNSGTEVKATTLPALSANGKKYKYAKTEKGAALKAQPFYNTVATDYTNDLVQNAPLPVKSGDKLYVVEVDKDDKVLAWVMISIP